MMIWGSPDSIDLNIKSVMDGKTKCKILKGIRQRIADINGIVYRPHLCKNRGDCFGSCSICDNELVWLEMQLLAKLAEGDRVYIRELCIPTSGVCPASCTQ